MSEAADFLSKNAEVRTAFSYFRTRPDCIGISWAVANGDLVSQGDLLCTFRFGAGPIEHVTSPIDGKVLWTNSPSVASLSHRPSQLLALLIPRPPPAQDGLALGTERDAT